MVACSVKSANLASWAQRYALQRAPKSAPLRGAKERRKSPAVLDAGLGGELFALEILGDFLVQPRREGCVFELRNGWAKDEVCQENGAP